MHCSASATGSNAMVSTASRAWASFERSGFPAFLLDEAHTFDDHRFIDRLQHVVERQAGDRHGGQRLHLDAGLAGDFDFGCDADAGGYCDSAKSTVAFVMASGWQSGISSCVRFAAMMPAMRAAPSTSPFLAFAALDQSQRFWLHGDEALGDGACAP